MQLAYRRKYVLLSSLRMVRAVVWCRIRQMCRPAEIVLIESTGDLEKEGDRSSSRSSPSLKSCTEQTKIKNKQDARDAAFAATTGKVDKGKGKATVQKPVPFQGKDCQQYSNARQQGPYQSDRLA
ncbi:hypothetical protein ACEQ8H_000243 [Pleosporales sp. CAS-2024a]